MATSPAPWKRLLSSHLSLLNPPICTLATTTSSTSATTNPSFTPSSGTAHSHLPPAVSSFAPRCRTIIFRGFLSSLPENKHNPLAHHNPASNAFESDVLTFTTDSRMTKTGELMPGNRSGGDARIGTAGGAEVEILFWITGKMGEEEEGVVQDQWRIRGGCFLLAEEDVEVATGVTDVLKQRLVPKAGREEAVGGGRGEEAVGCGETWSWKKEIQAHFGNLSPAMRGSFANPPSGMPLGVDLDKLDKGLAGGGSRDLIKGRKVEDADVLSNDGVAAIARRNFRVGVVVPDVVERVDLSADEGRGRRWFWWRTDGEGEGWKEVETWP